MVPVFFAEAKRIMLVPDRRIVAEFRIPRAAMREAFGPRSAHRQLVAATVEPIRALCEEHGLFRPHHAFWWSACGLLP